MKMNSRFRNYLRLEVLVVVLVMASFRLLPDKKTASLLASLFFVLSTLGILYWELRIPGFKQRPTFWGGLVFLFCSVLPILGLRLVFWDMPFEEIQVLHLSGAELHRFSNYFFLLLLVCIFVDSYNEARKAKRVDPSR